MNKTKYDKNIDITGLINLTIGLSGADIKNLVNLAALKAVKEGRE
jgi:ATP-dependent Zn protease